MIQQLVQRLVGPGVTAADAAERVLTADPFDLVLHLEQVWYAAAALGPAGAARTSLINSGAFSAAAPPVGLPGVVNLPGGWDHLGYSYVLENTRAVQIIRRVVQSYRSGESLGIPSVDTQRWLDTTEALLFGAANPVSAWLSTSTIRQDPENVRRNGYWRFFGLDLAFGTEDNRPPTFEKATAANTSFVPLFEELLFELWQAMSNVRNIAGANVADDDRIFRIASELEFVLSSRRQNELLAREELVAATALGWIELTLSGNSSVVRDLRAEATSPADRLKIMGDRVGIPSHSRAAALFSMAADLSTFLRVIESRVVSSPSFAWVLYLSPPGPGGATAIGPSSRRVITEWAAATGKDLKARGKAVEVGSRPRLAAVK